MVSISADEAYEDVIPGILHLQGHFRMQSKAWELTSTKATVYGSPNRPDRVYLTGSPARFRISQTDNTGQGPVEAAASVLEYQRPASSLTLTGGAVLQLGGERIQSTHILYDINTNRFQAGGTDGVMIEVPTAD